MSSSTWRASIFTATTWSSASSRPRPTGRLPSAPPRRAAGGGDRIPLYRDCDAFLEDFIGKASPASLELLRRGGLNMPEGAGKSPPGRGGASGALRE